MGKLFYEKIISKKSKIFKALFICLVLLWLPTIIVMILGGESDKNIYTAKASGKIVILENEKEDKLEELDVEDFIPCVVAAQLDINSEEELLKSFTVIIRTYINKVMGNRNEIGTNELMLPFVTYSEMEKAWDTDFTENYNKLMKAVENTSMEMIYYKDDLIVPYFHGISCGNTRNGNEVSDLCDLPYLKSVNSQNDMLDEKYLSMRYLSYEEFARTVLDFRDSVIISETNPLEVVSIVERDSAGYVKNIQIGSTLFTGDEFMNCFSLSSPNFQVEEYDGGVRIIVKGNGHGLGVSICGATNMAMSGSSYREIILYYYTDVEIK
ncbi:MAG: SpoIID/LytB domain-containing protein [Lachnospiraceae bacterium]|nr:SpoIID/LytB domain-containing protein [Lachnospiraceae bacterium]